MIMSEQDYADIGLPSVIRKSLSYIFSTDVYNFWFDFVYAV